MNDFKMIKMFFDELLKKANEFFEKALLKDNIDSEQKKLISQVHGICNNSLV
jgi:hypothetical protein